MPVLKIILLSVVIGTLVTAALTWAAFSVEDEGLSRVLLWQATLMVRLAGPGPLLGYDEQGNPVYEGTPVHMIAGFLGILLGVPIYSAVSFIALRLLRREGPRPPA